jgi:hypothetical protein
MTAGKKIFDKKNSS